MNDAQTQPRRILVVGIGAGDPEQITVQAINALRRSDVLFAVVKREETSDLVELRREICARYLSDSSHRWVEIADPERDRSAPDYGEAVEDWRRRRAQAWEEAIRTSLTGDEQGAFLVWGDPSVYDSTLAVLEHVARELPLEVEVVPGVSSVQALAARHGVSLTRVGEPVLLTTGRRLADSQPDMPRDVVVMLDAGCAFKDLPGDTLIYWGAYVGTSDEILVSGRVDEVGEEITERRRRAREEKGWIMDTYLLKRPS